MKRPLWLFVAVAIVLIGGGFAAWWFVGRSPGVPPPGKPITGSEAQFTVVAESKIELPAGVTVSFHRAVLHISKGAGGAAVRDYLKKKGETGEELGDLYEIFSNEGRFLAVGPALEGRLDQIPQEIEKILNPWKEVIPIGEASDFAVYQLR